MPALNIGVYLNNCRKQFEKVLLGIFLKNLHAPVAQLDRVLGYEPSGREFESLQARQINKPATAGFFICGVWFDENSSVRKIRLERILTRVFYAAPKG